MSKKGNSMNNVIMENLFGLPKQEDKYKNTDELIIVIDE